MNSERSQGLGDIADGSGALKSRVQKAKGIKEFEIPWWKDYGNLNKGNSYNETNLRIPVMSVYKFQGLGIVETGNKFHLPDFGFILLSSLNTPKNVETYP